MNLQLATVTYMKLDWLIQSHVSGTRLLIYCMNRAALRLIHLSATGFIRSHKALSSAEILFSFLVF